jgi:hypothetical protein
MSACPSTLCAAKGVNAPAWLLTAYRQRVSIAQAWCHQEQSEVLARGQRPGRVFLVVWKPTICPFPHAFASYS